MFTHDKRTIEQSTNNNKENLSSTFLKLNTPNKKSTTKIHSKPLHEISNVTYKADLNKPKRTRHLPHHHINHNTIPISFAPKIQKKVKLQNFSLLREARNHNQSKKATMPSKAPKLPSHPKDNDPSDSNIVTPVRPVLDTTEKISDPYELHDFFLDLPLDHTSIDDAHDTYVKCY